MCHHMRYRYIYHRRKESLENALVAVGVEAKAHTLNGEGVGIFVHGSGGMPVQGGGEPIPTIVFSR